MHTDEFLIFSRFLRQFDDEVMGHESRPLSGDEQQSLRLLAAGSLEDTERDEWIRFICDNRQALDFFADALMVDA